MLGQRFNRGRCPAASVLDQRNEHPAHAGSLLPRAVKDILPGMNELLRPRQRPIAFAVAHAAFARTVQVIKIRHIQVNAARPAPAVIIGNRLPLRPLGILQANVAWMIRGTTYVTRVGAIVLQKVKTGFFIKGVKLSKIIFPPTTPDARGNTKDPSGLASRGINDVVICPDATAGQ